jgi:signal transduction histidine kinase/CheY-like chemotaxis protein
MASKRLDVGRIALLSGLALFCAAVISTFHLFRAEQRADARIIETLYLQERLSGLTARIQDSLIGERGYLISGKSGSAEPYREARRRLPEELVALKRHVADNPQQMAAALVLERCAADQVALMGRRVALIEAGQLEAARTEASQGRGKRLTDRCRAIIGRMKREEARLLDERIAAGDRKARILSLWLLLCAAGAIVLGASFARYSLGKARYASAGRDELAVANSRLHAEAASREVAETQLRQLQKMESIGQLTGGIAHDFNNMLAIVIGSLDLARRRIEQDAKRATAHIDAAMAGAQRAAQLTSQLLAFGRRQPLAPTALDASRLIRRLSELLRRTIGGKVDFQVDPAIGLWPIFADVGQLESALVNLCVNARDAMPEGGKLGISTANVRLDRDYAATHPDVAPGDYVRITVQDSGKGMPPEIRERAFEPFFTTKALGKGTGLGLSQVYGFVKQSGGHVTIESDAGRGTTVHLFLPRYAGKASENDRWQAGPETRLPCARDSEIVLVVDDDEKVRELAVDALRELGYIVLQAPSGDAALALLESQPRVDLLLTDVLMPGMGGSRLAERIAEVRPEIRLLYMSGYPSDGIVRDGMLAEGVALLTKPFTVAQLAVRVRQALDGTAVAA